ncbi:MAG: hypothetical protein WC459_02615 [Patescibacteria group bacterium]
MQNQLLIQYGAIRAMIGSNVETIKKLIDQAENLKKIVEGLGTGNEEIKRNINEEIAKIENTIGDLITQTENLFDKYNEFVKDVFSK